MALLPPLVQVGRSGQKIFENFAFFDPVGTPRASSLQKMSIHEYEDKSIKELVALYKGTSVAKESFYISQEVIRRLQYMYQNNLEFSAIDNQPSPIKIVPIFTDGACPGNHQKDMTLRRAGWAVVFKGEFAHLTTSGRLDLDAGDKLTNNVAELTAILNALRIVKENKLSQVALYTDNEYCLNTLTRDAPKWKARGWRLASGKPVANMDLVKNAYALYSELGRRVKIIWTKGHSTADSFEAKGNQEADDLANKALHE